MNKMLHPFVHYLIRAGTVGGVAGLAHGAYISQDPLTVVKHTVTGIHFGMSAPLYVPIFLFGEPTCPRLTKVRDAVMH